MTRAELARIIDHTQVRAQATQADITSLCAEAIANGFGAVTVNPAWTAYCAKQLAGKGVGICPTIGFPLGANTAHIKVEETRDAIRNGATEIDMVINIGALKSGFPEFIEREIRVVVNAAGDTPVKVILETSYLTNEEKRTACEICREAGAAYIKTSTGFGTAGATVADVALIHKTVGGALGIKAAGGIRNYRDTMALIQAGATRIGTSAGIKILAEAPSDSE